MDLQSFRDSPEQVASGPFSFIGNGVGNTTSSEFSTVLNGASNSITISEPFRGTRSSILGGVFNVIRDSDDSVIVVGDSNEIGNSLWDVVGGLKNQVFTSQGFAFGLNNLVRGIDIDENTTTDASRSVAIGASAHAHMPGSLAHSSRVPLNNIDIRGRQQYVRIVTRGTTEEGVAILLNADFQRLTFPYHPNPGAALVTVSTVGEKGACVKVGFRVIFDGTTYNPDPHLTLLHPRGFADPAEDIVALSDATGFTLQLTPEESQEFCGTFKITMIADSQA